MKKFAYFMAAALLAGQLSAAAPMPVHAAAVGIVNTSALNVRSGASTSFSKIGLLYSGAKVTILGTSGNWYQISATINGASRTGYVYKDYIDATGQVSSGEAQAVTGNGRVNVSALNVRQSASTSSKVLGVIRSGAEVSIIEVSGSWYKVSVSISGTAVTGYVYAQYITRTSSEDTASGNTSNDNLSSGSEQASSGSIGKVNTAALNFRTGASTSASRLGCIYKGQQVTILGQTGGWYQIKASVNGTEKTGYVSAEYITVVSAGNTSSGNPAGGDSSVSDTNISGTVNDGPLNVRSGASTGHSILGYVNKGTVVTITGTEGEWYKVSVAISGRTVNGYVFAKYVTKASAPSGNTSSGSGSTDSNTSTGGSADNNTSTDNSSADNNSSTGSGSVDNNTPSGNDSSDNNTSAGNASSNNNTSAGNGSSNNNTSAGNGSSNNNTSAGNGSGSAESVAGKIGVINEGPLNVRSGPSTDKSIIGYLNEGTRISLLALEGKWYKAEISLYGSKTIGYVHMAYVDIEGSTASGSGTNASGGSGTSTDNSASQPSDAAFEQQIAGFPESYKPALRTLHQKYPSWVFKAVNTGIDWNSAVAGENILAVNTIQTSMNANTDFGKLSTMDGAYNWATDQYTVCDAGGFYTASEDVLKYYMDPRNMLTEKYIFQFEYQAYDDSQSIDVVRAILNGTFMAGDYTYTENGASVTKNYAETYMEAGKNSGVSPYFLASRSRLELGPNGSGQSSGNYGQYKGYYNFYSIGAFDSVDPVANGLNYAKGGTNGTNTSYGRPWTNQYKAIVGGADFLGASYIRIGQNTNYFQKFNVVYKQALYKHQYMTAVLAPQSESSSLYNSYKQMCVLDKPFVFYIPVYNNMPATPCQMPAFSGNPNSYLKSLDVTGGGNSLLLTPTFNYKTTTYDLVVPADISQININAAAVSAYAKGISGTGTYRLNTGMNTFTVTCTAGNGTTTTYTLNISRAE